MLKGLPSFVAYTTPRSGRAVKQMSNKLRRAVNRDKDSWMCSPPNVVDLESEENYLLKVVPVLKK